MFFFGFVTDYVQVVDMGTLELRIAAAKPGVDGKLVRTVCKWYLWKGFSQKTFFKTLLLSFGQQTEPRFELRCSSDVIHIRTCSDSCAALMNLIQYVASYGDLLPPAEPEPKHSGPTQKTKVSRETKMGQNCNTYSGVIMLNLNMCFIRLNFPASLHLRHPSLLTLSSRCCRIWWVKQWRRQMGSIQ